MLTIKDLQSVKLYASARFDRWYQKAQAEFYKPSIDLALGMWFQGLTEEQLEQLRAQDPETMETLETYLGSEV